MWHHSSDDCTHFCYVLALFEEAFKRLDILSQETREEVPSTISNNVTNFLTQGTNKWYKNWQFASRKGKDRR
jgi:hypothetical protein